MTTPTASSNAIGRVPDWACFSCICPARKVTGFAGVSAAISAKGTAPSLLLLCPLAMVLLAGGFPCADQWLATSRVGACLLLTSDSHQPDLPRRRCRMRASGSSCSRTLARSSVAAVGGQASPHGAAGLIRNRGGLSTNFGTSQAGRFRLPTRQPIRASPAFLCKALARALERGIRPRSPTSSRAWERSSGLQNSRSIEGRSGRAVFRGIEAGAVRVAGGQVAGGRFARC